MRGRSGVAKLGPRARGAPALFITVREIERRSQPGIVFLTRGKLLTSCSVVAACHEPPPFGKERLGGRLVALGVRDMRKTKDDDTDDHAFRETGRHSCSVGARCSGRQ